MKYSRLCWIIIFSIQILGSCKQKQKTSPKKSSQTLASIKKTGVVDITAQDFKFDVPDSLPSGWITFNFHNEGTQTHFFMLNHLPQGKTINDYKDEIVPPFNKVWAALRDSGITQENAIKRLGSTLPTWTSGIFTTGGAGLIKPGGSTTITVKLVPGNYEMECYVKSPAGVLHGDLGMINGLVVTSDSTTATPPMADINLTLSHHEILSNDSLTTGKHTIAVHYKDPEPFGVGDDVHLVQLSDTTNMKDVINWMNWMNVHGLEAPAPAQFLGGIQELPQDDTGYFTVDLKPGRYAWIAESYASRGMLKQFTVK